MMTKQTYLTRLSRAARWRLPPAEAAEVLSDYQELLDQDNRPGDTLVRELGDPVQAIRLLSVPRDYRRWLVVFGVLTFCLLIPEIMLLRARFGGLMSEKLVIVLLLLGAAASLIWFRPVRGEGKKPLPRGLLPCMAGLLAALLAAGGVLWGLASSGWEALPPRYYGMISSWALWLAGTFGAAAGFCGLMKARMADRRWRALYVLGLAVLAECTLVIALLASMSLDGSVSGWWIPYAVQWGVTGAVGLVGAGICLC